MLQIWQCPSQDLACARCLGVAERFLVWLSGNLIPLHLSLQLGQVVAVAPASNPFGFGGGAAQRVGGSSFGQPAGGGGGSTPFGTPASGGSPSGSPAAAFGQWAQAAAHLQGGSNQVSHCCRVTQQQSTCVSRA